MPSLAGTKKVKEELDLYAARVAAMREAESTPPTAGGIGKDEAVTPVAPRVKPLSLEFSHTCKLLFGTNHCSPSPNMGHLIISVRWMDG